MQPLYTLTIFVSAALLFLVQPMFARMVLPLLGGSPAVWNTAMLFFQAALLGGYSYAHFVGSKLSVKRQVSVHTIALVLPLLALPLAIPANWVPPASTDPTVSMLLMMLTSVGPPFLLLATTSPLLQRWFSESGHAEGKDPYFLYAAGNAGSLLALLGYPILIETSLTMEKQRLLFSVGYLVFALLAIVCGRTLWSANKKKGSRIADAQDTTEPSKSVPWVQRCNWIILSFAPSSLMLSVTTFITSDIASVPMLWVIPLGIYLATFIVVFARRQSKARTIAIRLLPIALIPLIMSMALRTSSPMVLLLPLHLLNFALITLLCHGRLADSRPAPQHLTEFYFCMSIGGVLGGLFNAIIAPLVFTTVTEYPITLVLGVALSAQAASHSLKSKSWLATLGYPALIAIATAGLIVFAESTNLKSARASNILIFGLPLVAAFLLSKRPLAFAAALGGILLASNVRTGDRGQILHQERSFFGVHRVTTHPNGRFTQLLHGHTLHGWQSTDPKKKSESLTYFHRTGPIGQAFSLTPTHLRNRVGIIGLGAGSMAAFTESGQHWTYYEIDPTVLKLASDPSYFTFLQDAKGITETILGDARLTLAHTPDQTFGFLILDAYSSDAIPMHLITREAFKLYLRKLAPAGVLALHVSNRNLDLQPVLRNLAIDANLVAFIQDEDNLTQAELDSGKLESTWMIAARKREHLGDLPGKALWHPVEGKIEGKVWTDDFYNLVGLLK